MSKPRKKKRAPKRMLALPDLEQSKTAVLNSLTSQSGQRTYDRALTDSTGTARNHAWHSTAPSFCDTGSILNRNCTRQRQSTSGWQPSDGWRLKLLIPVPSVRNWQPEFDGSRECAGSESGLATGSASSRAGGFCRVRHASRCEASGTTRCSPCSSGADFAVASYWRCEWSLSSCERSTGSSPTCWARPDTSGPFRFPFG
jgi:hypothetical protein